MPVGKGHNDAREFTYNEINPRSGDMIYHVHRWLLIGLVAKKEKLAIKQLEEFL